MTRTGQLTQDQLVGVLLAQYGTMGASQQAQRSIIH